MKGVQFSQTGSGTSPTKQGSPMRRTGTGGGDKMS